jgi:glycopeptide antibiotics resistance protein
MKTPGKWGLVCSYTAGIFIVTPYLPNLIRFASSRWSSSGVSRFVLRVEIVIALLALTFAILFLFHRMKKAILFAASLGGLFLLSFILYQSLPNPYEFTHLPEYAALSILIVWALDKKKVGDVSSEKEKIKKSSVIKNPYLLSAFATGIVGTGDEIYQHFLPNRYFTVYDIFLNILGGILGLLIFWGIKR